MAKLAQAFAKYIIHARMDARGIVEKPDVIGAIFGQTEGLLGSDLDFRELQRTGPIGRICVDSTTTKGTSYGAITIPSSLDSADTSLIAATLETIDKIGPCEATVSVGRVEDVRLQKRQYVMDRAKEILRTMMDESAPRRLGDSLKESVMKLEISDYHGLPCGPDIEHADELIVVEGRADVITLLKNGITNVLAIEGSTIPEAAKSLTRQKTTTAFLDGDRGGDLSLKKLLDVADIDYIARADEGKEVEELTKKEIYKALRSRVPQRTDDAKTRKLLSLIEDVAGSRSAYLLDSNLHIISKIPTSELADILNKFHNVHALVFDGKISQTLIEMGSRKNISCIVGTERKDDTVDEKITTLTLNELRALHKEQVM